MELKTILAAFAGVVGTICVFAALIMYAMSKIGGEGSGGGVSEGKMMGLGIAAIAAYAASAFILLQDLTIETG